MKCRSEILKKIFIVILRRTIDLCHVDKRECPNNGFACHENNEYNPFPSGAEFPEFIQAIKHNSFGKA